MRKRSKRYKADAAKVERQKKYPTVDAVKILKSFTPTKTDQTVEIAVKLAIDPKKSEQSIRGSVSLPKGIGKARRVIVFADGAEAQAATELGADAVGMDDLAKKIEAGWFEFDVAIAMPRTMRVISKLGELKEGEINPATVESLFSADLSYLQEFYRQINESGSANVGAKCPSCGQEFQVDIGTGAAALGE